jgi:hypothetical protein
LAAEQSKRQACRDTVAWIESDRFTEIGDRVVEIARVAPSHAAIVEGKGIFRVEGQLDSIYGAQNAPAFNSAVGAVTPGGYGIGLAGRLHFCPFNSASIQDSAPAPTRCLPNMSVDAASSQHRL